MTVDTIGSELTDANNSTLCLLRVVDKAVRVMLVEGKPYWDSKFLIRELASDASIEMHSLVQVAPGRVVKRVVSRPAAQAGPAPATTTTAAGADDQWQVAAQASAVLADPAALNGFQILILGRDTEDFLSPAALANLQRWISREGGALLCYRGSPVASADAALARLLPVKWQPAREARYQIKLTDTGRTLNWFGDASPSGEGEGFLSGLPPLSADSHVEHTKPLAVVVAHAQWQGRADTPAVTYQPYGSGRVVVIEGAGMWRWAFPPVGGAGKSTGEEAYGAVWHGMFRWIISGAGLVPGENAAIRPDKIAFNAREPVAATVLLRVDHSAARPTTAPAGAPRDVTVLLRPQAAGGADRTFPCEPSSDDPGTYRVQFGVLPPGRYTASLSGGDADAAAVFDVKRVGEEELNLAARPDVLTMVSLESGGAAVQAADLAGIAGRVKTQLARARPERVAFTTAWDRAWVFAGIIGLWACAWAVRRASGLV
jgi:hypothetical protein